MAATIRWQGLTEFEGAIDQMTARITVASRIIAERGGLLVEAEIKKQFQGAHRRGAPHVGGSRPNIVSGNLRRSIKSDPIRQEGPGVFVSKTGPTAVYGRRVELGWPGGTGPGHQATRPFPYVRPGLKAAEGGIQNLAEALWRQAVGA